ncbi:unnamed protein product [Caenorhabditis nigoni]
MSKTKKISPKGIKCALVNGAYEWQFYGGKVNNMAFAIQIPQCGCTKPRYSRDAPNPIIPSLYGTCDIFKMTCHPKHTPTLDIPEMGTTSANLGDGVQGEGDPGEGPGSLDPWILGFLDPWILESLDPWILGSLDPPGDLDPGDLDPGDLDPGDLDPGDLGDLELGDLGPGDQDPVDLDPGDLDPGDLNPGDRDPGDLNPGDRDPGHLDPGDLNPGDRDPGHLDPGDLDPGDLDPGNLDPGDLDPGDLDPDDLEPGDLGSGFFNGYVGSSNMIFSDLTCVNKHWYYNNKKIDTYSNMVGPNVNCPELLDSVAKMVITGIEHKFICRCREIEKIIISDFPIIAAKWVSGASYAKTAFRDGFISYDEVSCSARMTCTGSDTLVVFSGSWSPVKAISILWERKTRHFSMAQEVLLFSHVTRQQGYRMPMTVVLKQKCSETSGCACKYVPLTSTNIQKLVGSYSFYPYIGTRTIRTPTDNRPASLICPTEITCPVNFTLVVFDFANSSVFPSGKVAVKCATNTRKWTVDNGADVPAIDVKYAVCVDFR